jgi:C-terminal processing protease CtpA/Prc
MNRNCASSCEQFILATAYSDKVVLMGENTAGILDYGNVHSLSLPCKDWTLQYATSRSNRLPDFPIDNIGIEPNVKLGDEDWIKAAMKQLDSDK